MNHPTDDPSQPGADRSKPDADGEVESRALPEADDESDVEELTPDGGRLPMKREAEEVAELEEISELDLEPDVDSKPVIEPATPVDPDEDPAPELVWYVLKVQSSREDTIRDALERRVKIQGLQRFFGRIVVPTEKITEIRNNKKRTVERKTYPGYIMVEMELNEKTWFTVRETPGVGDFVGAHGTPTKMTPVEVNQMLNEQEQSATNKVPDLVIHFERGDRVKIKDGPFENFEGTVEEVIQTRGLIKVNLIIFNRQTPVDLEYWQVEGL